MIFDRAFIVLTYLVATFGFAAVYLCEETGILASLAMVISLVGSNGRLRKINFSPTMWRILTYLLLLVSGVQYFILRIPALEVARVVLIFLQINRLYLRDGIRDYAYIYLLAFLQMLLGCVLTIHPAFAFVLLGFLIVTTWAFLFLQLKMGMDVQFEIAKIATAIEKMPPPAESRRYAAVLPLLRLPFLMASGAVTIGMLVMTLLLFLITPRMEINLFQRRFSRAVHVAGFSEQVQLGEVGEILTNESRVMRVRIQAKENAMPAVPYWGGLALDAFDGQQWRVSRAFQDLVRTRPIGALGSGFPRDTNVIQRYTLEALDSRVMFVLPQVKEIESAMQRVVRNFTGSYESVDSHGRMDYVVYSRIQVPNPEMLRTEGTQMNRRLAEIYLQLPPLSPEVKTLAEEITRNATNDYDRVRAIEDHLRTQFEYTLMQEATGEQPIEDFLFKNRRGHCEYFATAMVMLCRSIGISSRIVNGFLGGSWNRIGEYFVLRQSDAHSWVEVWFDKSLWVRFDPTPSGAQAENQPQDDSWRQTAREYIDYLEMQWYHYILDYDLQSQLELLTSLAGDNRAYTLREIFRDDPRSSKKGRSTLQNVITVGLSVAGAAGILVWLLRRRQNSSNYPHLKTPLARQFDKKRRQLHRELEKRQQKQQNGETQLEMAIRAQQRLGPDIDLEGVERAWYRARFGNFHVCVEDVITVEKVLTRVRELPSPRRRRNQAS